ncbi:hypothetical protein [Lachnoclostridium sp.]|uniref:hypothetical protein n=1 Tax=Lachnoclostridium sp. TaxID=2028282 RepID=UPI00289D46B2|nr:hypothetical protein [Lachnoclostridium sp.]
MFKKLLSLALVAVIVIGMRTTVFAAVSEPEERYKPITEISNEELSTFALNFAKDFDEELSLSIGDILPMYNGDDVLVGFSLSYKLDEIPYGYINLDFTYQNPVTEFSIFEEAESLYDSLLPKAMTFTNSNTFDDRIYSISSNQYAISSATDKTTTFYFSNGEQLTSENGQLPYTIKSKSRSGETEAKYDSHSQLFSSSYASGSTVVTTPTYTSKYDKSKSLISESDIESATNKYACAVAALTAIANQEGIWKNSSLADTFNQLWDDTGTTVSSTSGSISYGSTYDSKLSTGMTTYAKARGKSNTTTSTSTNPSFSFFTGIITSSVSGTLSYRINLTNGTESGHTVNVVGYCVAKLNNVSSNYLIVADGWYKTAPKYINHSNTDFVDTYGVKYTIK